MLKNKLILSVVAALGALTLAASAGAQAMPELPKVPGGEMGCFVALSIVMVDSKEIAQDKARSQADRDKADQQRVNSKHDVDWFLGRIAMWPAEKRSSAQFSEAFQALVKLKRGEIYAFASDCSGWAADVRRATLDGLQEKK